MATLFHDPCGMYYASAQITRRFTSLSGATVVAGAGVGGRDVIRLGSGHTLSLTLPGGAKQVLTVGTRVKVGNVASTTVLLSFLDTATVQLDLFLNTDGTLSVRRNASTVLGTSVVALSTNEVLFLEMKVTIDNAAGVVEVRRNGTAIIGPLTSQDTQQSANATANAIRWGTVSASAICDIQDIYVNDSSGAAATGFLGDVFTETKFVNGNGDSSDFVGSDSNSIDNYLLVDDATPDDDTTYVQSAVIGDTDLYGVQNLATSPLTIHAVTVLPCWRKTDATVINARTLLKSDATESEGSDVAVGDSYLYSQTIHQVDPATSAAWLEAAVNAIQIGVKYES